MTESLSQNVRGHVHNLNLPAFLQLIELERMSCTLNVEHAGQRGTLFLQNGELLDARLGRLSGEAAATAVLGWSRASITISGSCANVNRSIEKPMSYVIMEALRLQDEGARTRMSSLRPSLPLPPLVLEEESYGLTLPANVLAVAVVDLRSGVILAHGQKASVPLAELSEMALTIMRQEEHTLSCFGEPDEVEELVLTTPSSCELIRRLPGENPAFVLCVFKPDETNLVMARLELERLLVDPAWLPSRPD